MLRDNGTYWDSSVDEGFLLDPRNGFNHPERQFVKKWIADTFKEAPHVLDVPCGIGSDMDALSGCKVTAVDKTPKCLELLKKKHPEVETVHADIRSIPLEDAYADVVYARAIFEHLTSVEDVQIAMKECLRLAKKYVIYSFYLPFESRDIIRDHGPFFENSYSRDTILRILAEIGIEKYEFISIPQHPDFDGTYTLVIASLGDIAPVSHTPPQAEAPKEDAPVHAEPEKKRRGRPAKKVTV